MRAPRRVREPGAPTTLASLALVHALLAASGPRLDLVDEGFEVPSGEWRYVEISLQQRTGSVACSFAAARGDRVRIALLRRDDLERMRQDRPYGVLASTGTGSNGGIQVMVGIPGRYAVFIENAAERGKPAKVHLKVSLEPVSAAAPQVRYLSRARRTAVIAISLGVFFGIVVFAARRLMRGA